MSMPGFTAERTLEPMLQLGSRQPSRHHVESGVRPASCYGDCFHQCVADGGMSKSGCTAYCTQECGGRPPDNPPYQCTNHDNSMNHSLCLGGIAAWQAACFADCLTLGIGEASDCWNGCAKLGDIMRATCPPAVICV